MNYRFIKLPRPCPRTAYETAAQKIAMNAIRHPNVVAVYQMGNVGAPGISDLDIIIVVKDARRYSPDGVLASLNEDERYTLMHGLFWANVSFWRNKLLFFKFDNLRLLAGENIESADLPSHWLEWARLRFAVQHIIRVYTSLYIQLFLQLLKVRSLLCELNALRYDFEALSEMLDNERRCNFLNYLEKVQQTRARWFSAGFECGYQFTDLCEHGRLLLAEIIESLNNLMVFRFENLLHGDISLRTSAVISSNRMIFSTSDHVSETASWAAQALRLGAKKGAFVDFVAKLDHRIGQFKVGIPSDLFHFAINSTWQKLDSERRRFMETRNSVLSSCFGSTNGSLKLNLALPLLDFKEK